DANNEKNSGVIEDDDPKGKTVVIVPSDADSGDTSSSSDSEVEKGTLSIQEVAEDEAHRTVWVQQYEHVWGTHVEAAERTCDFDHET
ncbi:hypothetical protein MKX03_005479, partial [Papaver bracteatum]